uniref:phosphotransferase enzyme family protein n=1 Tax=Caldalkalibacillus mannanilyticus TaxID=1418 RepID=UPI00046928D5
DKKSHIDFELNWLNYLSENMLQVARPVPSKNKKLYEIIKCDNKSYILCAFEKASGKLVDTNNSIEWNENLFKRLGEIMGEMHSLTKKYLGGIDLIRRHEWNRDIFFQPEYNFTNDDEVEQIWHQITDELHKLPKTKASYGIIHNDLHQLNFFVNGENITVFDFDDCICSWYTFDIMLTMYQMVSAIPYEQGEGRNQFAQMFIEAFLQGYVRYNSLEKHWVDYFDLFLKYRRICSYRFIQYLFGKKPNNPHKSYCDWLRREILQDKQFVSLDIPKIKSLLG